MILCLLKSRFVLPVLMLRPTVDDRDHAFDGWRTRENQLGYEQRDLAAYIPG
jgi:hypothetical protein